MQNKLIKQPGSEVEISRKCSSY